MPNIYIPNKGAHDFSKAEKYGTLTYLTKGRYNLLDIGRMYRNFQHKLELSQDDDWILVAGATIMNILVCSIFAVKHKKLNLLIFVINDKGDGIYKKRTIMLDESEGE